MDTVFYTIVKQEVINFITSINKHHTPSTLQDKTLSRAKDLELQNLTQAIYKLAPSDNEMTTFWEIERILKSSRDETTRKASLANKNEGSTEPSIDNVRVFVLDFIEFCTSARLLDMKMEHVNASQPQNVFKYFCALYMATHYRQRLEERLGIKQADYFPELNQKKEEIFAKKLAECIQNINEMKEDLDNRDQKVKKKVLDAVDSALMELNDACKKAAVGVKTNAVDFFFFGAKVGTSYTPDPGFMKICLLATNLMIEKDLTVDNALKLATSMKETGKSYEEVSKSSIDDRKLLSTV